MLASYLAERRKSLSRSDTLPSMNLCLQTAANQAPSTSICAANELTDPISQVPLVSDDLFSRSESREQKYLSRKQRGCSPPSNIKYRIRHKSPAASEYRRKLSDTSIVFFDRRSSRRSESTDPVCSFLKSQMSEAAIMKLPRSLSKRMPRSGSAKNLMDLRDDPSLVWSEGKLMQKEINSLYKAIETNNVKCVETLLSANPSIANTFNNIDLTPLDVAMLHNHSTMAKRLIEAGARNNECFDGDPRILQSRLTMLDKNCATQLLELSGHTFGSSGSINRDAEGLEALHAQLKVLKANLEQMKPGSVPRKVTLEVAGLYSLLVTVYPPSDSIVTRYRIQWSRHADFREVDDEIFVRTKFPVGVYQLCDLVPHVAYFVRVSGLNLKGVGPSLASVPASAEPSCWTEAVAVDQLAVAGSRRCPHPQEWCPVQFDDEEGKLELLLSQWLDSVKTTSHPSTTLVHDLGDQKRHIPGIGGRKSLLKALFASSSRFVRQPKHGLYLALVYKAVDNDRFLTCGEEQLPFVVVDEDHPSLAAISAECIWLMRLLAKGPDLKLLVDVLGRLQLPASVQLRVKFIITSCQLQMTFGTRDLGLLYPCVIQENNYSVVVLTKQIPLAKQLTLPTGLKWSPLSKLSKTSGNINDSVSSQSGLDEELYSRIETFISFFRRNNTSLEDGLYLGYARFKSTLDQLYIQQNIFSPTIFPVVKIRDNWHVDKDEWDHFLALKFQELAALRNGKGSKLQSAVIKTWQKLQTDLKLKAADSEPCRLYLEEILWLKQRVSVILVVPSIEDFCGLPGREIDLPLDYEWVPLHAFEYYHFHSHLKSDHQFSSWASLYSSIEVLLPIAQHCLRQGFDQHEVDKCRERLDQLQAVQNSLEHYWKSLRWSVDVISNCRDKVVSGLLTIPTRVLVETDALAQRVLCTEVHCPEAAEKKPAQEVSREAPKEGVAKAVETSRPVNHTVLNKVGQDLIPPKSSDGSDSRPRKQLAKGTIRVFAGYPCGLLEGTSVKLLLNSHTTTADVIRLIVTQLNSTAVQRNPQAPQYHDQDLGNFCLEVSIDKMSRPLPDNFHPLLLKQPWKSGRLTVKLRSQVRVHPGS